MAAIANLIIDQGATFSTDITVKDVNGDAFNLTGYTADAAMARSYQSIQTRQVITANVNSDPTTGIVTLSLTADQTLQLDAPARYVYDVEITNTADSTITRVIEGIITVTPHVLQTR
jgi:hypothetical protein